jgi:hypothetical protein
MIIMEGAGKKYGGDVYESPLLTNTASVISTTNPLENLTVWRFPTYL